MTKQSNSFIGFSSTQIWAPLLCLLSCLGSLNAFSLSATSALTTRRRLQHQHQHQQQLSSSVTASAEADEASSAAALRSITFSNLPKDDEPDVFCDFLMEIGACSAAVTDADAGTPREEAVFGEPSTAEAAWFDSLHWASPVWNRCNVTAHFPASIDLTDVLDTVRTIFPEHQIPDTVEQVPNKDWVIHVQSSWKPIVVADQFVLTFPWHDENDIIEAVRSSSQENFIELQLQGGIAFGTGEHATTQLCMEWLNQILPDVLDRNNEDFKDDEVWVMDYGAGSGILGMAACKLAQQLETNKQLNAIGVDIDVDACRIANFNAQENQVNMQNYLPPLSSAADDFSKALLLKARQYALTQLNRQQSTTGTTTADADSLFMPESLESRQYQICVANILAGPLIGLAPTLAALLHPGGYLGLSGILQNSGEDVAQAYRQAGFENVKVQKKQDGWALVTGRRQRQHDESLSS